MRRRADVVEATDDSSVIAAPRERPPQMKLAERASPRIGIATDEVDVVALEIGWREHRGLYRRSFEVCHVATEPRQDALIPARHRGRPPTHRRARGGGESPPR